MAYDEDLAERIRDVVGSARDTSERKMFGGLAFLFGGHMGVVVLGGGGLMIRMAPEAAAALVDDISVAPMVMQGRELDGWLRVSAAAVADEPTLGEWIDRGAGFARSLPPKKPKSATKPAK
ncbi:TfoX/Sxy family protein [Nocardia flavorosea]|uniref:RNA methyltransferase n=1 Tax=Nocardia flavorosea TaxID=53429 RepID=A0A846YC45_9NOCA|nr:TfoX/Sxy family protein [Nocardia flavorosea]NKY55352.1 RNA methyltransferase [Nocardia flavorosea]